MCTDIRSWRWSGWHTSGPRSTASCRSSGCGTSMYGPGEQHKGKFASMIWQLSLQMKAGKKPRRPSAGEQKRDFVSIEDMLQANQLAMKVDHLAAGGGFQGRLWSGQATLTEVIAGLNAALGTKLETEYFDESVFVLSRITPRRTSARRRGCWGISRSTHVAIAAYMKAGNGQGAAKRRFACGRILLGTSMKRGDMIVGFMWRQRCCRAGGRDPRLDQRRPFRDKPGRHSKGKP